MKRFLCFVVLFFICFSVHASSKFKVSLDKCIDGDTAKFVIDGEVKTVRFLSIDAPEIAHDDMDAEFYGEEARRYVCNRLKKAYSIKLQYDPKSEKVDKYNRVLAWVFVDDTLLQEDLVRNGYAEVKYVYDDYLYSSNLKNLEALAKDHNLGMWGTVSNSYDNNYLYVILGSIFLFVYAFIKKFIYKVKDFFKNL